MPDIVSPYFFIIKQKLNLLLRMQIAFDVVKKEHLELRYLYANKMVEQGVQD